jgi:mannose-6-phosphate isomerase
VKAYIDWVKERALPRWATSGFDAKTDRFFERLGRGALPLDIPHRAMVQARQIYVYAHAEALGWFPGGSALADKAMTTLVRDYAETDGNITSFAFSIDPATRAVTSAVRDSYTHAFILFAIAQLFMLNGDKALWSLAETTTAFLEREMLDATHGGVVDALPAMSSAKRQNPQMHLLEAYLALEMANPGQGYLERAGKLVSLFRQRMVDVDAEVLLEHFSEDWGSHPDPAKAKIFEPGHHYEWVWLLHRYEGLSGTDHSDWRTRLMTSATSHGLSPVGLIYDEVTSDKIVCKESFRLWPHTEAIKAAAVQHLEGDREAETFAKRMASGLLDHFLDKPFTGGWTDQCAPDLSPIVDYVPASSLYHLFLAAAEADACFGAGR